MAKTHAKTDARTQPPYRTGTGTGTGTDRAILAGVAAVGLALVLAGGLARWVGVAGWLAIAPDLLRLPQVQQALPLLRRWLPSALVVGSFIALMHPLLLGHMPASRDHGIHFFQTRVLFDELLPSGRLWGWSTRFNHGYPFGESYPTLGYLAAGAAHALTFGVVSLRTSYAWAIAGFWALGTIAVWWLAAELVRELRGERAAKAADVARWGGAVAAILWLFDPGASRQGGWNYAMFHGVWPQMLSAVLWTMSLVLFWRALSRPSPRALALAGAALGGSVLAHPFGVIAAAGSAVCWLVLVLLRNDPRVPALRIWLVVHLLGGALCVGWLAAFFGSAGSMDRSPVLWRTLGDITYDLATGDLFRTHWAWLGPLFVAGLGVALVRRRPFALLVVALTLAMIVLASRESMWLLDLDLLLSGFKNLQFPRYTIEFKPLLFAICGVGAAVLGSAVPRAAKRWRETTRSRGSWFVAALLLAPFAVALGEGCGRLITRPVGALDTLQRSPHQGAEADLLAALREEATILGEDRSLRVAVFRQHMGGGTYPILSVTDAGGELVLDGHVPAVNFRHRVNRHTKSIAALNVTHAIYDRKLPDRESKLAGELEKVGKYGPYTLARLPDRPTKPEAAISGGDGRVTVTPLGDEGLSLQVSGTTGPVHVALRRALHVRWEATFEGEPIEIGIDRSVRGFAQMGFDVPGDGAIVLQYQRSGAERAAQWTSLAALTLVLVGLFAGGRGIVPWAARPLPPRHRVKAIVFAALAILVVLGVARARQQRQLATTWAETSAEVEPRKDDSGITFVRDAVSSGDLHVGVFPSRTCDGLMGKDVLEGCDDSDHAPQNSAAYRAPYLFRCVEFTVAGGGNAAFRLDNEGHDVVGFIVRRESGTRRVKVGFGLGDSVSVFRTVRRDFYLRAQDAPDGLLASLANAGRDPERFCIAAALVDP